MTDAVATEASADPPTGSVVNPDWRRLSRRMLLVHPVQETPRSLPA